MRARCVVAVLAVLLLGITGKSEAGLITIALPDIQTFTDYSSTNTAATFTGNGFAGMYGGPPSSPAAAWVHIFGVEYSNYSRSLLQADISALAGQTITSATLQFSLLAGGGAPSHGVALTGYDGGSGVLSYEFAAPSVNYGVSTGTVGAGVNSLNVTSLLIASVTNGDTWFGMHLTGTDNLAYRWTDTNATYGGNANSAAVSLRITTADVSAVPEPSSLSLLALGSLTGVGYRVRRRMLGKAAMSKVIGPVLA